MFIQRKEGESYGGEGFGKRAWDLGLRSPTPSGLVNRCEQTPEVMLAPPSHKLPNQFICECSLRRALLFNSELARKAHFLRGFSGHLCSDQASLVLQNVFSEPPGRSLETTCMGSVFQGDPKASSRGFH